MSKTKMEKDVEVPNFDLSNEIPMVESKEDTIEKVVKTEPREFHKNTEGTVNCLRNERVIVRFIPKAAGLWNGNPKHVLAGGMGETSIRTFCVPRLSSGMYVNVLTDSEKAFLEEIMGLEYNALSIYKKIDNFWDDSNNNGINTVRLTKQDNFLDLSNPEDYIRYKILLANKNFIAPSLQELEDRPKASYQFVIVADDEETKTAKGNMTATMKCYKEFGKIENDVYKLRTIIEILTNRPTAANSKLDFLQTKVNELIQLNSKRFLATVTDPMLDTKILIKKGIETGVITNRGNYLYVASNNLPLCENGEEPTLNIASKYLNQPKHQDVLFSIQALVQEKLQ